MTDQAFAWRMDVHGPNARYGGSYDAHLAQEAVEGAQDALKRLPANAPALRIAVTRIKDSPVDTAPGDVKHATTQAVRRALDINGDSLPPSHPPQS
ncbi:hypothetical protein [Rhizohabitans arisaemae]|uniref:hypothetical protein n=1 Tax=Rhizohabitans arisaemae TaxID=2720610 RepID=UPI0024B1BF11|nr:hypothetical protein [Rhizohabitans arisaemae]